MAATAARGSASRFSACPGCAAMTDRPAAAATTAREMLINCDELQRGHGDCYLQRWKACEALQ